MESDNGEKRANNDTSNFDTLDTGQIANIPVDTIKNLNLNLTKTVQFHCNLDSRSSKYIEYSLIKWISEKRRQENTDYGIMLTL